MFPKLTGGWAVTFLPPGTNGVYGNAKEDRQVFNSP